MSFEELMVSNKPHKNSISSVQLLSLLSQLAWPSEHGMLQAQDFRSLRLPHPICCPSCHHSQA